MKAMCSDAPTITSFDKGGILAWESGYNDGTDDIARVEMSPTLNASSWQPFRYDFLSTNLIPEARWLPVHLDLPRDPKRTVQAPMDGPSSAFYRVAIQTNAPDPDLVLHLTFDNDLSHGVVLDSSGHGNHGLRYSLTNWPVATTGPDGRQGAVFRRRDDGSAHNTGDYVAVLTAEELNNLSRATIAVWAHHYRAPEGNYVNNHTATLLDASSNEEAGSWLLGRLFEDVTSFSVSTSPTSIVRALRFPDKAPTGDTGGWHHYAVTFDGEKLVGYYDGQRFGTFTDLGSMTELNVGGPADYIALGTWHHNGTPQFGTTETDDQYPNCCWLNGAMDDVRIYRRALDETEVLALYNQFDKEAPAVPAGLWVRAAADNQLELRWEEATDEFYVAGYEVRRNGAVAGTAGGPSYVDGGLLSSTEYQYTVEAFDGAGNRSGAGSVVAANTPAAGSPVEVVVDNSDGEARVSAEGTWITVENEGCWGGDCVWGSESRGTVSMTYRPDLPEPGEYEVYVWYGGAPHVNPFYIYATNVPIDIVHSGVTNTVQLNQQGGYDSWALLGTYSFAAGTNEFVRIRTDGTAFNGSWGAVMADAVMFVK